jgi:hypothetical protein
MQRPSIIASNDPRLISSAALIDRPFEPHEHLWLGDDIQSASDKIFALARVVSSDEGHHIIVDEQTPTGVFNDAWSDTLRAATGRDLPLSQVSVEV